MPVVNPLSRELVFKIVYYGPGLGGKTTSLSHIHATSRPEHRGRLVSLATPVDRTLYFDFLPVRLPSVRGMGVRLQLFTVPGQVYYNATRKLVLTGADGIVLVADSQAERADANLESLENLMENLREHGRTLEQVPHVLAYNKRDLPGVLEVAELDRRLNREGAPAFPTVAVRGDGVFEALDAVARSVLADFERRVPAARSAGASFSLPEGGIAEVLRTAPRPPESVPAPAAPLPEPLVRASEPPAVASVPPPSSDGSPSPSSKPPAPPSERRPRPSTWPSFTPQALAERAREAPAVEMVAPSRRSVATAPSFALLFAPAEAESVARVEAALAAGEHETAFAALDRLASRVLASMAAVLGGGPDAPRDPAVVVLLLGVGGPRYLEFRAHVRDARAGRALSDTQALAAYAFVIELATARARHLR